MLKEEDSAGTCFITFEDFDSSDRVLLDMPHYLNGQLISIHKYNPPEDICSLSQYRFIHENNAHHVKRWYPVFRNLIDLVRPLKILYKTQYALIKHNRNKQIFISNRNLNEKKDYLHELENKYNDVKRNFIQLCHFNRQLQNQIEEIKRKNEKNKNEYENQIREQERKNQLLKDTILSLRKSS